MDTPIEIFIHTSEGELKPKNSNPYHIGREVLYITPGSARTGTIGVITAEKGILHDGSLSFGHVMVLYTSGIFNGKTLCTLKANLTFLGD